MDIPCRCASCGATLLIDRQYVGRLIQCPVCSGQFVLAEPEVPKASPILVKDLPAAPPQQSVAPPEPSAAAAQPAAAAPEQAPAAPDESEEAIEESPTVSGPGITLPAAGSPPPASPDVAGAIARVDVDTAPKTISAPAPPTVAEAPAQTSAPAPSVPAPPSGSKRCPECGTVVMPGRSKCPECGYDVDLANLDVGEDLPRFVAKGVRRTKTSPAAARKRKKLFAIVFSAVTLLVVLSITGVGIYYVVSGSPAATPKPPKKALLKLDWPEKERVFAELMVDGQRLRVPDAGPVEYRLDLGKHRVKITRQGCEPIEKTVELGDGEKYTFQPQWTLARIATDAGGTAPAPAPGPAAPGPAAPAPAQPPPNAGTGMVAPSFDDWLQDFEAAKAKAAAEKKEILIAFDGSDWCGWSIKLGFEVFFQKEFRERAKDQLVLVIVDFPRKAAAKAKVQDPTRNRQLAKYFNVRGYPTIVLTDAQGRPYGFEGYVEGGVSAFLESVGHWQQIRQERDKLFYDIDKANGQAKLGPVQEALKLLRQQRLTRYYGAALNEWLALAQKFDPKNEQGIHETLFEAIWLLNFADMEESRNRAPQIVAELDEWKKDHPIKDPDRGARLHLYAATALAMAEQTSAAMKYVEAGLAYKPKDPELLERLNEASVAVRGIGSGTGFVVAPGGYVLTNHHVIEGAGKVLVQLPGQKEPVPAQVAAKDGDQDLALLKVKVPQGVPWKPLPLSAVDLSRGAKVGAFGFAVAGTVGAGLKLTTGVVSSLADQSTQGMLLLDCRVNPGNSGGPLCDSHGNVVGMVTAKSVSGFGIESYGMALPAEGLRAFLTKHVPGYGRQPAAPSVAQPLEWDQIDRLVGPSVLMIIRSR